ncbi:hypothetical protein SKAU_G00346160 [Synaphobranchus kaupii]|uniref:Uncharacterized protein n=1 Tax=Synaphobranchus kaupii TaxID=118154 RepID=A0A9Q1EJJ9_SYNKA|nr:hypothetical protein SKAU_G00346160 [Synaphobranchus kaupii]
MPPPPPRRIREDLIRTQITTSPSAKLLSPVTAALYTRVPPSADITRDGNAGAGGEETATSPSFAALLSQPRRSRARGRSVREQPRQGAGGRRVSDSGSFTVGIRDGADPEPFSPSFQYGFNMSGSRYGFNMSGSRSVGVTNELCDPPRRPHSGGAAPRFGIQ